MRYYVDGKEISKEEADKIKKNNQKYMESNDLNQWGKIKFVVEIAQSRNGGTSPPSAGTAPPAPMMAGHTMKGWLIL